MLSEQEKTPSITEREQGGAGKQKRKIRGSVSFDPITGLPTIKPFKSRNISTPSRKQKPAK
jgi:hypothetical protein